MEDRIVESFAEAELLVAPEALALLRDREDAEELARKLIERARKENWFSIERQQIEHLLIEAEEDKLVPPKVEVHRSPDFKPLAKEYAAKLELLDHTDVTGKSKCTGHVEDFVAYFLDRLRRTRKIIEQRGPNSAVVNTKALRTLPQGREVRLVGLVTNKQNTRKGDLLLEIEDEEGSAKVWVGKGRNEHERRAFESAKTLVLDEVAAFDGKISGPFLIVTEVLWPDVPIKQTPTIKEDLSIAFLSDIHVGSKLFLEPQFKKFLRWLNGETGDAKAKELAGKVKYLFISGDVVDGIGIYPKQEKELVVRDIYGQYEMFGRLLEAVPDYIEVVVAPGNHDAVRRAEPQPRYSDEIIKAIKPPSNAHFVGSPSMVEAEGLKALLYHGTSLDSVIAGIPGMSYAHPEKPMIEVLKRRNLCPIFGQNPLVPEHHDFMLIDEVPDILHMGHIHKNAYENYKGVVIVNSGTWQDRTEYQAKQGHMPSPCKLPIYNMHRSEISELDFNQFE